jgi:hypothetical protein
VTSASKALSGNPRHNADAHDGPVPRICSDLDGWLDNGREPFVEELGARFAVGALVEPSVKGAQSCAELVLSPSPRLAVKAATLKADVSLSKAICTLLHGTLAMPAALRCHRDTFRRASRCLPARRYLAAQACSRRRLLSPSSGASKSISSFETPKWAANARGCDAFGSCLPRSQVKTVAGVTSVAIATPTPFRSGARERAESFSSSSPTIDYV